MAGNPLRQGAGAPIVIVAVIALCALMIGMGYHYFGPSHRKHNGPSYYVKDPNHPVLLNNNHTQTSGADAQSNATK